jgi:hypothetical protein
MSEMVARCRSGGFEEPAEFADGVIFAMMERI